MISSKPDFFAYTDLNYAERGERDQSAQCLRKTNYIRKSYEDVGADTN